MAAINQLKSKLSGFTSKRDKFFTLIAFIIKNPLVTLFHLKSKFVGTKQPQSFATRWIDSNEWIHKIKSDRDINTYSPQKQPIILEHEKNIFFMRIKNLPSKFDEITWPYRKIKRFTLFHVISTKSIESRKCTRETT